MSSTDNTDLPEGTENQDDSADESGVSHEVMAAPLSAVPELSADDPQQFELLTRLDQLEEALLARDPMMKQHLGAIHKQLTTYEELVHLLTIEQIAQIVGAQQQHTNTTLLQEVTSKAGKAKAANRTAGLKLSDL